MFRNTGEGTEKKHSAENIQNSTPDSAAGRVKIRKDQESFGIRQAAEKAEAVSEKRKP